MRILATAVSILQNRCGGVSKPRWCTFLATYRCNARCTMCDSWKLRPGRELDVEQIEASFAKLGVLDVVRLTGGEPFLRMDLAEIVDAVGRASRPAVVHITTNGSFPERAVKLALSCSQDFRLHIMTSLDGMQETHDRNRGAQASFETAVQTIRELAKLRKTRNLGINVNHTIVSAQSMREHARLVELMREIDVDVHAVPAYADSAMYGATRQGRGASDLISERGYPLHPDLGVEETVEFCRRELSRLREMHDPLMRLGKRYYLRGLISRLRGDMDLRFNPPCVELRSHIRLLPDGRVPICQFNTRTVGDLSEQTLAELWRGNACVTARRWVDACPGCWAECEVTPNAVYTGDILRP